MYRLSTPLGWKTVEDEGITDYVVVVSKRVSWTKVITNLYACNELGTRRASYPIIHLKGYKNRIFDCIKRIGYKANHLTYYKRKYNNA